MRRVALAAGLIAVLAAAAGPLAALASAPSPAPTATPADTATPTPALTVTPTAKPAPSPPAPTPSPTRAPSPAAAAAAEPTPTPIDPAVLAGLQGRLGADLAQALAAQLQLSAALDRASVRRAALSARVDASTTRIADLEDQVSQLDDRIAETQHRIDGEQAQVTMLARALYRRPESTLLIVASSPSLRDAVVAAADMVVAGRRAHALQSHLEADLAEVTAQRAAVQSDLAAEAAAKADLEAGLATLEDAISHQELVAGQLGDLISQVQDAVAGLQGQPVDVTTALARLLEQQQRNLIQASRKQAWDLARVGAGRVQVLGQGPAGQGPAGLHLAWPERDPAITQGFGPSDLWFEPPLGEYPHFHTGLDMARPEGEPVLAAAGGVVVAAALGRVGYGNFVVLAHGDRVETLYGHLQKLGVAVGDRVSAGQVIGLEGSTGFSTGPHLHFELRVGDQVLDPLPYLSAPSGAAPAVTSQPAAGPSPTPAAAR